MEGTDMLLSPPIFRKYLTNLQCKRIRIKEKEDKTHVTVIDIQALYPIPIYCTTLSRLTWFNYEY